MTPRGDTVNNYKFGNYICKLREEKQLTQAELASKIDVSDKAVSKWENGQAFPRIETLEKLAAELNTTVEDIFSASKDGVSRICICNDIGSIMHIDINGQLLSIRYDESKWIEIDKSDIIVSITFDLLSDSEMDEIEKWMGDSLKEKVLFKLFKKGVGHIQKEVLRVNCGYKITGVKPDTKVTIQLDDFDLGDKTMIFQDFHIVYPKVICEAISIELLKVKAQNSKEVIKNLRKIGLRGDLGSGFLVMLLYYPIRGIYFKHLCKPHILKKNIQNAEIHKQRSEERKQKKIGCLPCLLICIALFIFTFVISPAIFVESEKPYLVAKDYSTITYYDDIYKRIDELPESASPAKIFDATIWEDARTDGLSKWEQSTENSKVQLFEDRQGRKYLWLIENYSDSEVLLEDKEYDDFDEHYVYVCENPD